MKNNFLIVGLGSAGQRHARILRKTYPSATIFVLRGNHIRGLIAPNLSYENFDLDPVEHYRLKEVRCVAEITDTVDLTIIATPPNSHCTYAFDSWEISKRLLIEKPLSNHIDDCRDLINRVELNPIPILVGYQHQFNPIFRSVKEKFLNPSISWKTLNFWFQEPLTEMNPFRDMAAHHLAKSESGSNAALTLSHELYFLLELLASHEHTIEVESLYSITWENVFDTAKLQGSANISGKGEMRISGYLSYANEAKRRGGVLQSEENSVRWNMFTKELRVGGAPVEKFDFSADTLMELQLREFMTHESFDQTLRERLSRAAKIVEMTCDRTTRNAKH